MIVDALMAAEPVMNLTARVYDAKRFRYLTDAIITEIEQSDNSVRRRPVA